MTLPVLVKQKFDYSEELIPEDELYQHTRYRWLSNDSENLAIRYRKFNPLELIDVATKAVGNGAKCCIKILKCLEGQYNKAYILTMDNGMDILAKLPNPNAGPKFFTTASEVATRHFIHEVLHLPIPKIYAHSSNPENPVGAEYIIEEKVSGVPLSSVWYKWSKESKMNLVAQLVDFETQLTSIRFQRHGCIYYKKDLEERGILPLPLEPKALPLASPGKVSSLNLTNEFGLGPLTQTTLWQNERATMNLDRGPWSEPFRYMAAMGYNELLWAKAHAKPRISRFHVPDKVESPEDFISLLNRYMALIPRISPAPTWTSLSHPDLHLGNIFVDPDTNQIASIIDWQSASVCEPYFQRDIPRMLTLTRQISPEATSGTQIQQVTENKGSDEESELLQYYQHLSQLKNSQRWAAMNFPFRNLITEPTTTISAVWEKCDVYSLYDSLINIASQWNEIAPRPGPCPIQFSERELEYHSYETHTVQGLSLVLHQLHNDNLVPLGGMVYQERYEHAAAINRKFHKMFVDMVETEEQKQIARRVWPYQDRE